MSKSPAQLDLEVELASLEALRARYVREAKEDAPLSVDYYRKLLWSLDGEIVDVKSRIAARSGR